MIKFDIGFIAPYILQNIHLLLIMKSVVHYLGLPLIAIFSCDMLQCCLAQGGCYAYESWMHLQLLVLSSVFLGTSQG